MRSKANDRLHQAVREQGIERGEDSGTLSHGRLCCGRDVHKNETLEGLCVLFSCGFRLNGQAGRSNLECCDVWCIGHSAEHHVSRIVDHVFST